MERSGKGAAFLGVAMDEDLSGGRVINVLDERRGIAGDGCVFPVSIDVGRLKRDREADVLLSECVRGASCNGFVISDPGVGDGTNAVLISE